MNNKLVLDVIIEVPKGSNVKYEFDPHTNYYRIDRILYGSNVYPQNYGFLPQTIDYDGDPLDVLVFADHAFFPTTIVPTRILGAMAMVDNGETDTKLIGVIDCDPRFSHFQDLSSFPAHQLKEIEDFFLNYKRLQYQKVVVSGFQPLAKAQKIYHECVKLYEKYHHWRKEEFVAQMRQKHPEKYLP